MRLEHRKGVTHRETKVSSPGLSWQARQNVGWPSGVWQSGSTGKWARRSFLNCLQVESSGRWWERAVFFTRMYSEAPLSKDAVTPWTREACTIALWVGVSVTEAEGAAGVGRAWVDLEGHSRKQCVPRPSLSSVTLCLK